MLTEAQVIKQYEELEAILINLIVNKLKRGNSIEYHATLLKQIESVLEAYRNTSNKYATETLTKLYNDTQERAKVFLEENNIAKLYDFATINQSALLLMTDNYRNGIYKATEIVGRRYQDLFRKVTTEIATRKLGTGETVNQARKLVVDNLTDNGITNFTDSAGKQWSLKQYATMAIRSTTTEVINQAVFNQAKEYDMHLMKFSRHGTSCPICGMYAEGRVYSLKQGDKYTWLYSIPGFKDGYNLLHPNCRHVLMPYIEALDDNPQQTIQYSNNHNDERTEAQKRHYEARQTLRAEKRKREKLREEKSLTTGNETDDKILRRRLQDRINFSLDKTKQAEFDMKSAKEQWQRDMIK